MIKTWQIHVFSPCFLKKFEYMSNTWVFLKNMRNPWEKVVWKLFAHVTLMYYTCFCVILTPYFHKLRIYTWDLHAIYMSYTCEIHIIYMKYTLILCIFHVNLCIWRIIMKNSCICHVHFMFPTCIKYVYTFFPHAYLMLIAWDIHDKDM